ncbi:unnamed protein product [Pedinophyceae sp. YPF-701]|nr:unnamed protein product [Pedinophyceae sp. YPF-701]
MSSARVSAKDVASHRPATARPRSTVRASAAAAPPSLSLKYNKLGSSDLLVSDVTLGTMTFGQQNTEKEAHEQLSYAADIGVNLFDTAEIYPIVPAAETQGRTSEYIGSWLASSGAPARDSVYIATKVAGRSTGLAWVPANRTVPRGEERNPRVDAASIVAAAEAELRRLRTDYLDLLQIHWPDRYAPLFGRNRYEIGEAWEDAVSFEEQAEAMGKLVREGKIRHWGLSNETSFGVMRHCQAADAVGAPRPVSVQNQFSLVYRTYETEMAETCAPHNCDVGLLPWSVLAGGALTGKYLENQDVPGRMSIWPKRYARFQRPEVKAAIEKYVKIAKDAGLTPAQLSYAWCRSRWYVPTTIIGATTMEQLKENMVAFSVDLDAEVLEAIDAVHRENRNVSLQD